MKDAVRFSRSLARRAGSKARLPALEALRRAVADDVLRMLGHEPGARRGEPDQVHQMRTSVRRLRSDLRFFGPAMGPDRSRSLRDELRWLAGVLGAVRDLDVLGDRLRSSAVSLGVVPGSDPLFEEIDRRAAASRAELVAALDGDRYAALRGLAIAEARSPTPGPSADRGAADLLIDRLRKDWHGLLDQVRETPADSPTEALHDLRKRAKRSRYAAESASEWLGGEAGRVSRRVGRRSKALQEVLGELQDATVAADFIRGVVATVSDTSPFRPVAAAMIGHQDAEAEAARSTYRDVREPLVGA